MYDAYAGVIDDPVNLSPYLPDLPTPSPGASPAAAIAAAAHTALSALYPSQQSFFDDAYMNAGLGGPNFWPYVRSDGGREDARRSRGRSFVRIR
jgi:hypothetical protein